MKDTTNSVKDKTTTEEKKEAPFKLPMWVFHKALKEGVTIEQLAVYWWIYTHNAFVRSRKKDVNLIFGKPSLKSIHNQIEADFNEEIGAEHLCKQLESKGWIKSAAAPSFNGVRQKGYLCLLVESDRLQARAVQQEMQLTDEEAVIEVESSLPDTGEYIQFGIRYYDDADGNPHQVPSSAPPRPTKTAIWSSDPEGWYEPDEVPERECEY